MSSQAEYEPVSETDSDNAEAARPRVSFSPLLYHVRSSDGQLTPLILQSFQDAQSLPPTQLWQRMGTRPPSPTTTLGKMSYWVGAPIMQAGSGQLNLADGRALGQAVLRLVVSWPLSFFLFYGFEFLSSPFQAAVQTPGIQLALSDTRYQPVRQLGAREARAQGPRSAVSNAALPQRRAYTDDIDLDAAISEPQNGDDEAHTILVETSDQGAASRPRHLCYIRDPALNEYETINVSQFLVKEGDDVDMEFVFVSYTREQFRVATDEEIDKYTGYPDEATREANRQLARKDRAILVQWGLDAAKRAGKRAFWIDFECVRDRDGVARTSSKSDDVYRICDVVRAAHSMIIATGPPASEKVAATLAGHECPVPASRQQANTTKWLRHWGSRLWTLPELLLCPSEHRVELYVLGSEEPVAALAKRNFAERAWDDAELVKELVNHYEGSAILSEIRLVETALECFARRGTHQFSPGDNAYALMGLLPMSQRPAVHPGDSGFQAFARLSLANDGGAFLSRMLCLLPPNQDDHDDHAVWYDNVKDVWGARIRDVHPSSRVVKIAADARDTLVLDGAPSAAVRWDAFDADALRQGEMPRSQLLVALLVWSAGFGLGAIGVLCLAARVMEEERVSFRGRFLYGSLMCIAIFGLPALLAPLLYLWHQRGSQRRDMQAQLVGLEGHVDAGAVERHLWGHDNGLLTLVATDDDSGFLDDDDGGSSTGAVPQQQRRRRQLRERFNFTLVDTHMMTVRHIAACKPPVAVFAMGSGGGGGQRAMLCSYDWRDDTFERTTVIRVDDAMVDQMRRINQFRVRLRSHTLGGEHSGVAPAEAVVARDTIRPWQQELLFAFLVAMAMNMLLPLYRDPRYWYMPEDGVATQTKLAYCVAFLLTQGPAFLVVTRTSLYRVVPQLVLIKAFSPGFSTLLAGLPAGAILRSVVAGAIDGIAYPVLASLVWLWFGASSSSPSKLLARALVLSALSFAGPPLARGALLAVLPNEGVYRFLLYFFDMVGVVLRVIMATMGRRWVGRPDEVAWLPASRKAKMAAPADEVPQSAASRKRAAAPLLLPLVVLVVSTLAHLATNAPRVAGSTASLLWLLYAYGAITVVFTICVARFPKSHALLLILVIVSSSAGSIWQNSMGDVGRTWPGILVNTRILILPLIWVQASSSFESWPLRLQVLCLSLVGVAVDGMLKTAVMSVAAWQVQASAGALAILLLVALWVHEETSRRRRISLE